MSCKAGASEAGTCSGGVIRVTPLKSLHFIALYFYRISLWHYLSKKLEAFQWKQVNSETTVNISILNKAMFCLNEALLLNWLGNAKDNFWHGKKKQ